jgi:hypothetical protein
VQCFKHDLISASCDHAIELKAKGNLSISLGGSECSLPCIGSSGVGSSECVNPGNDRWKLTTGEPFYNIPDLFTGCFESGGDSIEMLVGMKELMAKKVWAVLFDLNILDNGGHMVDGANVAAVLMSQGLVCFSLILAYSFVFLSLTLSSTAVMLSKTQLGM